MEFSEEKSLELKKRFKVSDLTIRLWRIAGQIPDKYLIESSFCIEDAKGECVHIKELRKRHGLTREVLSDAIFNSSGVRISPLTIRSWELGATNGEKKSKYLADYLLELDKFVESKKNRR